MKINNLLLPHPVLGRGDDVEGEFKVPEDGFVLEQNNLKTKITVEFFLNNKTLENLILSGDACFNVELECASTFYRNSFLFSKKSCICEIDKNNLRGKVNVFFYITSNKKISQYIIEGANEDYGDSTFEISEGDVLAYAGSVTFDAEILWEDLRRIFNIMKIRKDTERESGSAITDLNGDVIIIYLSKNDYLSYENYKDDFYTSIYHSSLVLSSLIYALSEMMSERKDNYLEWKWYRVLDSLRNNNSEINSLWDVSNIPLIAQTLLGNPIRKMLETVENLSTRTIGE